MLGGKLIALEGNIGSGKSLLLETLKMPIPPSGLLLATVAVLTLLDR